MVAVCGASVTSEKAQSEIKNLQNINPGNYTIMTSYVGFERFEKKIILKVDQSVKLDISLIELVVELSGISVTDEKLQRTTGRVARPQYI